MKPGSYKKTKKQADNNWPMNPEIKERWLTALRSGEYRQVDSYLKHGSEESPGHCCLGVLCELYAADNDIEWKRTSPNGDKAWRLEGTDEAALLPPHVAHWAGFGDKNLTREGPNSAVDVHTGGGRESLAGMNDDGSSFEEIANVIEECL